MTRVLKSTAHCLYARPLLTAAVVALALFGASKLSALQPANPADVGRNVGQSGRQVALYDQLRVGLKAKTKADFAFISLVVQKVDSGVLPRKLVDSSFLYARQRSTTRPDNHPLRPMVYFQPVLTMRAKQLGILL